MIAQIKMIERNAVEFHILYSLKRYVEDKNQSESQHEAAVIYSLSVF